MKKHIKQENDLQKIVFKTMTSHKAALGLAVILFYSLSSCTSFLIKSPGAIVPSIDSAKQLEISVKGNLIPVVGFGRVSYSVNNHFYVGASGYVNNVSFKGMETLLGDQSSHSQNFDVFVGYYHRNKIKFDIIVGSEFGYSQNQFYKGGYDWSRESSHNEFDRNMQYSKPFIQGNIWAYKRSRTELVFSARPSLIMGNNLNLHYRSYDYYTVLNDQSTHYDHYYQPVIDLYATFKFKFSRYIGFYIQAGMQNLGAKDFITYSFQPYPTQYPSEYRTDTFSVLDAKGVVVFTHLYFNIK